MTLVHQIDQLPKAVGGRRGGRGLREEGKNAVDGIKNSADKGVCIAEDSKVIDAASQRGAVVFLAMASSLHDVTGKNMKS